MTKKDPLSIDIVISAYNEEACIADLLGDVLRANSTPSIHIENIYVISDASQDRTDEIVLQFGQRDSRVKLIRKPKRLGKSDSLRTAFSSCESDVLVLFDADIRLGNDDVLRELVEPIRIKQAALVGANVIPKPLGFKFNAARSARHFDWLIEDQVRHRKPVSFASAYGRALAMSREFYQGVLLPSFHADDLYLYYWCLKNGYTFVFSSKAIINFNGPHTLLDYIRQYSRFYYYTAIAANEFGRDLVYKDMKVSNITRLVLLTFIKHPLHGLVWILFRSMSNLAYLAKYQSKNLDKGLFKTKSTRVE